MRMDGSDLGLPKNGCSNCGASSFRLHWQVFLDAARNIRIDCAFCDAFVCYASQIPQHLRGSECPANMELTR